MEHLLVKMREIQDLENITSMVPLLLCFDSLLCHYLATAASSLVHYSGFQPS